jgi:hypothetical protein
MVESDFAEMVQSAQALSLNTGLILGAIVAVTGLLGLMLNLAFVHGVARLLFKGQATFTHLLSRVVSFYNARLPIVFGLMYLGIVATFLMGGGIVPPIIGGLVGLFSLFVSFKVVGRVGEAYHFGFLKAFLSMTIASFLLGIIGVVIQLLAFNALAGLVLNTMA